MKRNLSHRLRKFLILTRLSYALGAAFILAALVLSLYGIAHLSGNGGEGEKQCSRPVNISALKAKASGAFSHLQIRETPKTVPDLEFLDPQNNAKKLSDFKGQWILLNLWATWCTPCREEMPALNALQQKLGSNNFQVMAINIDTRNRERVTQFLDELKLTALPRYNDPTAKVFQTLKTAGMAFGMPTTLLISPEGCEIANMAGAADWASEQAIGIMNSLMNK